MGASWSSSVQQHRSPPCAPSGARPRDAPPASGSSWRSARSSWSGPRPSPSSPPRGRGEGPLFPLVYLMAAVAVSFLSLPVGLALVALAVALELGVWWYAGAPPDELPGVARPGSASSSSSRCSTTRSSGPGWRRPAATSARRSTGGCASSTSGPGRCACSRRADSTRRRPARRSGRSCAVGLPRSRSRRRWRGAGGGGGGAAEPHLRPLPALRRRRHAEAPGVPLAQRPRGAAGPFRPGRGRWARGRAARAGPAPRGTSAAASYYVDGTRPRALLAVPLVDRRGGHVRGVLVADRLEDQPFDEADENLVTRVAGELIRAVDSERMLLGLQAERDEKELFYGAIERLNRKSKTQEVLDAAIEVASRMVPLDFGAVTLFEPEEARRPHRVVKAVTSSTQGWQGSELEGRRFSAQTGPGGLGGPARPACPAWASGWTGRASSTPGRASRGSARSGSSRSSRATRRWGRWCSAPGARRPSRARRSGSSRWWPCRRPRRSSGPGSSSRPSGWPPPTG